MVALRSKQQYSTKPLEIKQTQRTGWGIFALADYEPGDPILLLDDHDTANSKIVKWQDSFGKYFDRGYTIVPDFAFCAEPDHPFWNLNHSCNPNAGYINWGDIQDSVVVIAAYRHIAKGEEFTVDYSTFTTQYDGTLDGQAWTMSPCCCGQPDCRGVITGFEALPLDLQMKYITATGKTSGRVVAHIVSELPALVEKLKQTSPRLFAEYQRALDNMADKACVYQSYLGPSVAPSPENRAKGHTPTC